LPAPGAFGIVGPSGTDPGEDGRRGDDDCLPDRGDPGRAAIRAVEVAMEVAGGAGFFREAGLERLFRDVQGARYHPVRGTAQLA
jgi:Acyl-CoA dehydrogenase, C-terminal domain